MPAFHPRFEKLMQERYLEMGRYRARLIASYLESFEGAQVLDVGSGPNRWYDHPVVRMDIEKEAEADIQGSVEALPFQDEAFDVVVATELIEHVRYPATMLQEIRRVLRDGGELLLSTPNVASLHNRFFLFLFGAFVPDRVDHDGADLGHIHFFDHAYVRRLLTAAGFDIVADRSAIFHVGRWVLMEPRLVPSSLRELVIYQARKASLPSRSV